MAVCAAAFTAIPGFGWGWSPRGDTFMGVFLQGEKVGYMSLSASATDEGTRTLSVTKFHMKMLGQETKIDMLGESVADKSGALKRLRFSIASGGRSQTIVGSVEGKALHVTRKFDNSTESRILNIPDGAKLTVDPMAHALSVGAGAPGTKVEVLVFDPIALTLVKTEVHFKGEAATTVRGKPIRGSLIEIVDPRSTTQMYIGSAGEVIAAKSVFGIEMVAMSRAEALGSTGLVPSVDLIGASRVLPDRPIPNPRTTKRLKLRLEGEVSARLKSDAGQTVVRENGSVILTIAPVVGDKARAKPISKLAGDHPEFSGPADLMPAASAEFRDLAQTILGGETNSLTAAEKISAYVHRIMTPNASIAVIRNAAEILETKEGVCRDYAVLACTLLRAAGIPSKLVAGAVYAEEGFYYHAWVEAWTGAQWVPLDPTLGSGFDATHIKFTEGNPETTLVMFTLDGVRIKVLEHK